MESHKGGKTAMDGRMWQFRLGLVLLVVLLVTVLTNGNEGGLAYAALIVLGFIGTYIYFVPAIRAYKFNHLNKQAILVLNFTLGWLFIPWVIALVWAYKKDGVVRQDPSQYEDMTPKMKTCPYCAEAIRVEAIKCRYCQSELVKDI